MIVVQLNGGLGNQMFQYALGRRASLLYDTELVLDIAALENKDLNISNRSFELTPFPIQLQFANDSILQRFFPRTKWGVWYSYLENKHRLLTERDDQETFAFLKREKGKNLYIQGYWQNPAFFEDISDVIKNDFSYNFSLEDVNYPILTSIRESNSVSVHVRRGDYASNPQVTKVHGLLDDGYFNGAVQKMGNHLLSPHFFIFSEDIEWCRSHLEFGIYNTTFVHSNVNENSFKDMMLMKECKHNILSNSTFSWWGAWLNSFKDKIVIAPQKWFALPEMKENLIPKEWLRM